MITDNRRDEVCSNIKKKLYYYSIFNTKLDAMANVNWVGTLTSGGDAPDMNAAIRAVTRSAIYNGLEVKGIYRGYKVLINGEVVPFKTNNVSNII